MENASTRSRVSELTSARDATVKTREYKDSEEILLLQWQDICQQITEVIRKIFPSAAAVKHLDAANACMPIGPKAILH